LKKFIVMIAIVLSAVLFSGVAAAHTRLSASVPAENSVADSPVTEIVLDFNTSIEPVSRITVTSESGKEVPLQEVQVSGERLTGKLAEPLPNGAYTVSWKIIGADGHAVNGSYAFAVNVPGIAEPEASAPTATESPAPTADEQQSEASPSPGVSSAAPAGALETQAGGDPGSGTGSDTGGQPSNTGVYLLLAAAVILIIAIVIYLRIRRKA
jgi:hypothetical protein